MTSPALKTSQTVIADGLAGFAQQVKAHRSARARFEDIEMKLKVLVGQFLFTVEVTAGVASHFLSEEAVVERTTENYIHLRLPPVSYKCFERMTADKDVFTVNLNDAGLILTNAGPNRTWKRISTADELVQLIMERLLEAKNICQSPLGTRQPDVEPVELTA